MKLALIACLVFFVNSPLQAQPTVSPTLSDVKAPSCIAGLSSNERESCSEAARPLPKDLRFPNAGIEAILAYKNEWLALCQKKEKVQALSELLEKAQGLSNTLKKIEEGNIDSNFYECNFALARSIPGIDVTCCEGTDISPNLKSFNDVLAFGNELDKRFFNQMEVTGFLESDQPWIELTWDYGGCQRFGSYSWVAALSALEEVQKESIPPAYLAIASGLEQRLLENFHVAGDFAIGSKMEVVPESICVCENKEAVLNDLVAVETYFDQSHRYKRFQAALTELIRGVKNQEIEIKSEKEGHCSGG